MKTGQKIAIVIAAIVVIFAVMLIGTYNSLVNKKEEVDNKLANISVQLERRASVIPNIITTVKGYTNHEKTVIDDLTKAREKLVNANSVTDKAKANQELTSSLNNLNVIVENYPDLKANTNFIQLQDELAGSENRIATARKDYNDAVKSYNRALKSFPKNIIASMFGFDEIEYFEANEGSNEVPNVSFE